MRLIGPMAALALVAAAPTPAALQAAGTMGQSRHPDTLSRRLEVFDQVWVQIRDHYYDPGFNGADWSAVRTRYRPLVEAVGDDAAFHSLLRDMVGALRDAHTRLLTKGQAKDRREHQTSTAGVILFEVEGQPVIFEVRPGSPAAEAGLRPGMRVAAVNGVPVAEALRRAQTEVGPSSSERASRVLAYLRLIAGAPEESLRLRVAPRDGAFRDVALPRRRLSTAPRFESRRLASGDLYVGFDRFRKPVARLFQAALVEARDAPGLIVDLRSNTGGDGKEGIKIVAPLLDRPTLVARLATRSGKPPSALLGLVKLPLELRTGRAGGQIFGGPIVILTNEGTGSTAEVIAASLQERGRARVVGAQSCGCALGVLRYRTLKNGASLAISEVGLLSGLGRRIEGQGVVPDIKVDLNLADLEQGRDPVLQEAVRQLSLMR